MKSTLVAALIAVGLSPRALAGEISVAELSGVRKVVVLKDSHRSEILVDASTGGKLGWSFDLTPQCRIALIVPRDQSEPGGEVELVVGELSGGPDWRARLGPVLRGLTLSSPAFSPDGQRLAVVSGKEVLLIDLNSGKATPVGPGAFAVWEDSGAILIYDRKKGCHELSRWNGKTEVIDRYCGGEIAVPIASGVVPRGTPLPVVDDLGNLVKLLGGEPGPGPGPLGLSTVPLGAGCRDGATYTGKLRGPLSLSRGDGGWGFLATVACASPRVLTAAGEPDLAIKSMKCSR